MGRKGGGRAGFMKSVRHGNDAEEEAQQQPAAAAAPKQEAAPAAEASPSKPSAKASKFLKEEPAADAGESSDEEPRREGGETRGQVLQRHKREQKALKDQIKRLGKKGKDEGAKLEAEMEARHAAELAAFDAPKADTAAAVALAGSLYSVHLDGSGGGAEGEEAPRQKKPTKSQKRKEQRAQKEAEREARIAAELAELGDTDRVLEERALKQQLRPLGLRIRDIPPDGHCLYRSLEDQLRSLPAAGGTAAAAAAAAEGGGENGGEEGGEELSFLQLRQKAAEYMRANADHFLPFVVEEGAGEPAEAFEAYCQQVEMTAAWGGEPELQALAHALKAHILVYTVGMPVLEVGEEFKESGRTLRLCYLKHAYGLGEHYNSVQPGLSLSDESEGGDDEGPDEGPAAATEEEESS